MKNHFYYYMSVYSALSTALVVGGLGWLFSSIILALICAWFVISAALQGIILWWLK